MNSESFLNISLACPRFPSFSWTPRELGNAHLGRTWDGLGAVCGDPQALDPVVGRWAGPDGPERSTLGGKSLLTPISLDYPIHSFRGNYVLD
jgi:hypothetical protein